MRRLLYMMILTLVITLTACSTSAPVNTDSNSAPPTPVTTTNSEVKTFTLDELKNFNGENGKPAYVAVDGVVYDVSAIPQWKDGKHHGQVAGKDLTKEITQLSPHGKGVLKKLPVVGKLVDK